jgi:hypothetical protein
VVLPSVGVHDCCLRIEEASLCINILLSRSTDMHIPSFLVGTSFSGVVFLALHEQLSHRSRLSPKWKLRGA